MPGGRAATPPRNRTNDSNRAVPADKWTRRRTEGRDGKRQMLSVVAAALPAAVAVCAAVVAAVITGVMSGHIVDGGGDGDDDDDDKYDHRFCRRHHLFLFCPKCQTHTGKALKEERGVNIQNPFLAEGLEEQTDESSSNALSNAFRSSSNGSSSSLERYGFFPVLTFQPANPTLSFS